MQTVSKMHHAGGAAQVILVILAAVSTIEVEVCRLHTSGVRIGLLAVVISNVEAEICCVNGCSVLQLRLGTVVVDQLNGLNRGRSNILIVCAIDNAQVIQQDIALQVVLVQLGVIGGVPADAAGGDHCPEQHTAVDADHCTGILGQICLQILPSVLEPLTGIRAAAGEVDICVSPTITSIRAGGNLCPQPGYRHAFGNIHPDANGSGRTINSQVITQAKACTICAGKTGPVIVQPDGVVTKADNVGIFFVGIRDHRTLYHTAASRIVIGCYSIRSHAGKALYCGANGGIIPGILIAAIQDHGGLHTDVYGNRGRQFPTYSSYHRTARILHVTGHSKLVVSKGAGIRISNAPFDISILQLNALRQIGCLEAQITDIIVVQVYLTGGEL